MPETLKSRSEKVEFIRKVKSGAYTPDEIWFATVDFDKLTVSELRLLDDILVKEDSKRITIPDEYREQFEQLKKDYEQRNNSENKMREDKASQ
ncbi:hypothetical protein [Agriterribacter sp.]|uniref:hypothetical protein n=1 Tax=Agriterribacter sp. TaxID=2821509 RepID=UPI002CDF894B|nr:hypothetical protein [Agriterribacter sp.]HTN08857.1 hypothetical protein [Agriterribacter sp.]